LAYGFVASLTTASISDSVISGGRAGIVALANAEGAAVRVSVIRSTIERTTVAALNSVASGGGTAQVSVGKRPDRR
jgi:hypothetical protein